MKTIIEMAHEVYGANTKWNDAQLERLNQIVELARADEREACANVCESRQMPGTGSVAILNGAADAIRARSTHET